MSGKEAGQMKQKDRKMSEDEKKYDQLRQKFNPDGGFGIPLTPKLNKLLKFFCPTIEDVEICLCLNVTLTGFREGGKTTAEVAAETGKDEKKIEAALQELKDRGTVYAKAREGEPGVTEYSLQNFWMVAETLSVINQHGPLGIQHNKIVTEFYDSGARQEWARSKLPLYRTLNINESVDAASKVLWWEDAREIIKKQEKIVIAYCGCRVREQNCDHRIDTCLCFGEHADELVHDSQEIPGARLIKYVTPDEALKRLEESAKEGLVPITFNTTGVDRDNPLGFVCMCCSCCCHILGTYHRGNTGWGVPHAVQKSNFKPEWDRQKCLLCNKCVDICAVDALWRHYPHKPDLSDDFIFWEENRCIGCGICAFNCPESAITMKKVRDDVPQPDLMTLFLKMEEEQIH